MLFLLLFSSSFSLNYNKKQTYSTVKKKLKPTKMAIMKMLFVIMCMTIITPFTSTVVKTSGISLDAFTKTHIDMPCKRKLDTAVLKKEGCEDKEIYFHKCQGACYTSWKPVIKGITDDEDENNNRCISCLPTKSFKKIVALKCNNDYEYMIIDTAEECQCREMKCGKWGVHTMHEVLRSD